MDERVSSWRVFFALACALLMLASVSPDRLLDRFGQSPKVYDAVRPVPERGTDSPPLPPNSAPRERVPEVALDPNFRLASVPRAAHRGAGTVVQNRGTGFPEIVQLVYQRRVSAGTRFQERPVVHTDSSNLESASVSPVDGLLLTDIPLVILNPPSQTVSRRSYAELMEQFGEDALANPLDHGWDRVVLLPSPPPGEVRAPSWTEPRSLLASLGRLDDSPWAARTSRLVESLRATGSDQFAGCLSALDEERRQAETAAVQAPLEQRAEFRDTAAALDRRVELWNSLAKAGWPERSVSPPPSPDRRKTVAAVDRVDRWLWTLSNRREWAAFLCLSEIRGLASDEHSHDAAIRAAARRALGRLIDTPWSPEERVTLAREPLAGFTAELRAWAEEPVDFGRLLKTVEQFEETRDPEDATRLAQATRALCMSASEATRGVGESLNRRYRNANFVLRVQTDFLNRFAPQREAEHEWVRDVILGQPVRGNARTESTVHFRTVPSKDRIVLALEVEGRVSSLTSADAGPAVLFNNSNSNYVARKEITIDADGLVYRPSTAQVDSQTRLRGLRTSLDPIPVLGALVQDMVLSQHQQKKPLVRREMDRKVAAKATQRVDQEANPRLDQLSARYREEVLTRLAAVGIVPELIDAETTEDGFIAAFRVAAGDQLGSYEPPPVLHADAEAAVWLHQTLLNNLLERMEFNGKTFTAAELTETLSGNAGGAEDAESIAEKHREVRVTFAPTRGVQIACEDGVVELTLAVRELVKPPKTWRNFFVRARLKPTLEGKQIKLVRTGVVGIYGRKFPIQSQIALRGIFSKVFDDDRPFEVLPANFSEDERLAELEIAAFAVRRGWIVFALDGAPMVVAQNDEDSALH